MKNIKQIETGRSMVEMLGVLAIIGVISIGAIVGYTYGMNRYRTNEILDGANKRAYTISTQDSMGIPLNLSEFSNDNVTAGGTFSPTVEDWEGEFGITVSGVSKDVCENLIRMMGDKTTLRAITKTSDEKTDLAPGDCASPTNDLFLVYNKEMSAEDSANSGRSDGGAYIPAYCVTHTDECRTIEIGENTYTAIGDLDKNYNQAVRACDGEEHMVTGADLGCNISTWECSNAPTSGYYWLTGTVDGYDLDSRKA